MLVAKEQVNSSDVARIIGGWSIRLGLKFFVQKTLVKKKFGVNMN